METIRRIKSIVVILGVFEKSHIVISVVDSECYDQKGRSSTPIKNTRAFVTPGHGKDKDKQISMTSIFSNWQLTGSWFSSDQKMLLLSAHYPDKKTVAAGNLTDKLSFDKEGIPEHAMVETSGDLIEKMNQLRKI